MEQNPTSATVEYVRFEKSDILKNLIVQKMKTLILLISLSFASVTYAQTDSLRLKIEHIIASKKADIGVAIDEFESDTLSINGNKHFPMESVFKFHLAVAVLIEVDKGKLSLDQKVPVKKSDLLPNTWSPLRDKYPN